MRNPPGESNVYQIQKHLFSQRFWKNSDEILYNSAESANLNKCLFSRAFANAVVGNVSIGKISEVSVESQFEEPIKCISVLWHGFESLREIGFQIKFLPCRYVIYNVFPSCIWNRISSMCRKNIKSIPQCEKNKQKNKTVFWRLLKKVHVADNQCSSISQ